VKCSYVQIYNEHIFDLLGKETNIELPLRESLDTGVFIEGVVEYDVRSPKEVFSLLKLGRSRLIFAETKMNRNSSRSHAICFLTIERTMKSKNHGEENGKSLK
jgi:hypothetical protein